MIIADRRIWLLVALAVVTAIAIPFAGHGLSAILVGVIAMCIMVAVFSQSAVAAAAMWIVLVFIVPPWIYASVGGFRIAPAAIISIAVILARVGRTPLRFNVIDFLVVSLGIFTLGALLFANTPLHIFSEVLLEWLLCYFAGRLIFGTPNLHKTLSTAGLIIGALAIAQFLTGFDVATWPGFSFSVGATNWMGLQGRAGLVRAELTAGQSIALGGILALLLPFALRDRRRASRIVGSLVIGGGIFATLSRSSLLAGLVVVFLCLGYAKITKATKVFLLVLTTLAAIASATFFGDFLESSSGTELNDSTEYRQNLISVVGHVKVIGLASDAQPSGTGATYTWDGFFSIDNGFLYIALYAGAIVALCFAVAIIVIAWRLWRRGVNSFAIAILAQLPLLLTVAPITQYQSFFWLFVGLASSASSVHLGKRQEGNFEIETPTSRSSLDLRNSLPNSQRRRVSSS